MKSTLLLFAVLNAVVAGILFSKIGDKAAADATPGPVSAKLICDIFGAFFAANALLLLACIPHV